VAKAVLVSAIPPLMLKTAANPLGLPVEAFDKLRNGVLADRTQLWRDLSMPFFGYNRPGAKISEGAREQFVHQCMMAGFPASYFGIRAFSETDLYEDLKKIDVPTLVIHGDDDQIVPIKASALLSSKNPFERHPEDLRGWVSRAADHGQGSAERRPAGIHQGSGVTDRVWRDRARPALR
jgi:non-heme chloroperoxidase